jgi:hypothetical protein
MYRNSRRFVDVGVHRVQVAFPRDTGAGEDVVTNTFHFLEAAAGTSAAARGDIFVALKAFYLAFDEDMSGFLAGGLTNTMKFYDVDDNIPRVPKDSFQWELPSLSAQNGLPCEVSCVLSYHAQLGSGLNTKRRRGRIYLGPLLASTMEAGAGDMQFTAAFRAKVAGAASNLAGNIGVNSPDVRWCVFSPTSFAEGGEAVPASASAVPVVGGHVDNAADIQRRRGRDSSARVLWTD